MKLVESHCSASSSLAGGIHAVPGVNSAFATTQAAYRFLNNPRVTLRALAAPLIEFARQEVPRTCDEYLLIIHDWSPLSYLVHTGKKDRVQLSHKRVPEGYELQSALAVSDRDGSPIAPLVMSLRAADGVHCSRSWQVRPALSPLDELDPAMKYVDGLSLGLPTIHFVDAEADSVAHFRSWSTQPGRLYVVRGDDRLVELEGREKKCSVIQEELRQAGTFSHTREVLYHGKKAEQYVAEISVRLVRAGQRNRPNSHDRKRIPGPPLSLRLIISEVRSPQGNVLATWYLFTNVPPRITAATIVLWYYWRWNIEEYFKLLKSAGVHAEQWQQETAAAITRRLLVASMACVVVWRLARSKHPRAKPARQLLVRLSGRQMARGRESTLPAMLTGMWVLLVMLSELERTSVHDLRALSTVIFGRPP